MARVKLTEYRAKSLLAGEYHGVSLHRDSLADDLRNLETGVEYIIKVDQGIKKRGKQGLIRLGVTKSTAEQAVQELADRGFSRFIAEPMYPHDDNEEKYLSVERVRGGFRVLYSPQGGVEIEEHPESVKQFDDMSKVPLPKEFMERVVRVMDQEHLSFVEINPLVVRGEQCVLLDAAVTADSAGEQYASWNGDDIADSHQKSGAELTIANLSDNSSASFSFRVLNPEGAVWLLLSGGGASITIADEAANRGKADVIGNYGEYSGGPTAEETQVYTEAVIEQMLESTAQKKALVIAGGVANFTDVKQTFGGVVAALQKNMDALRKADVKVFVRRGGPNEKEGLRLMREFLKANGLLGSVHGSDDVLTVVVDEALEYVHA